MGDSSYDDMIKDKKRVSHTIHLYLEDWYGERCPDFDEDCILCQKWKAFDLLFNDNLEDINDGN